MLGSFLLALVAILIGLVFYVSNQINAIPDETFFLSYARCIERFPGQCDRTAVPTLPDHIRTFAPIQFLDNYILDYADDESWIRLSYYNSTLDSYPDVSIDLLSPALQPIAYFGQGGAVFGDAPNLLQPGVVSVAGSECNTVYDNMWQSYLTFQLADPETTSPVAFVDRVCYIYDSSRCGICLRLVENPGQCIYFGADHAIFNYWEPGAILSNSKGYMLVNGSSASTWSPQGTLVVTNFKDYGNALPIIRNPLNEPPASENLWLDVYNGTCTRYTTVLSSTIPINTCVPMTILPYQLALLASVNASATFAQVSTTLSGLTVVLFLDKTCTTSAGISMNNANSWGCNENAGNSGLSLFWRLQVVA